MVILMIKVIAFDLIGVLARENDYILNEIEAKIERLFGPNKSDEEFIFSVKENILAETSNEIIKITKHIINSIYDSKVSLEDLKELKNKYNGVKFVVATNHVSFVQEFIFNTFGTFFDKIYISAKMHQIKPNKKFYLNIAKDLNVLPNEILFLDDSIKNIQGAKDSGMQIIHVTKGTNILKEIEEML